ncbi:phosphoribosylaminoimidazolesuccinocarboxamide synthase [Fimbriimonas ginsengisoli]|uniref:Phosphoribosylaminoimidazole-succinocarboxamide synthase n=1 Tax=Fimbriimonas ginsengisoli Gsoil 348 TaxID=661478 RepID=A0A068NRW4_FIMGI|nr:phosphoribosylaminoimidazolesuccinocarboxamide synthase [Fimbriimonas ginsengisoli]AIE86298.1 phosphoribosylaminoimidazole-succinocarboxamide synthase [Fimbriimonas ginsengisoli Gsoil 348]
MPELLHTAVFGLPPARIGKVREVYDLGNELLIVATDRISAFDCVMANGIPDKGRILNQMSAFWFEQFGDVCPNHVISVSESDIQARCKQPQPELAGRATIARKAEPLPIECVARGYITGSLFKEYRAQGGKVHGLDLPPGLVDSERLPEPIFTPATKAQEGHDENISFDKAVDLVGREAAEFVREKTLEIYQRASDHALARGIILADTKFEFGRTANGIIWIDEALTPDSSRFWNADAYLPGKSQASYDKQFVRDYLETIDWDKRPPGPTLPPEIVDRTRAKYVEAFERLTGQTFGAQ